MAFLSSSFWASWGEVALEPLELPSLVNYDFILMPPLPSPIEVVLYDLPISGKLFIICDIVLIIQI